MHSGGCLCGSVRYRIDGDLAAVQMCHCEQCRKAQGTPFVTNIPVAEAQFVLEVGEDLLQGYESSPGKERIFCGKCGSPILSRRATDPGVIRLRAGTLDGSPPLQLGFHIFAAHKAGWWDIQDDLPCHDEFPR